MAARRLEGLLDILYPPDAVCFVCRREAVLDARGFCAECGPLARPAGEMPPPVGLDGAAAGLLYTEVLQDALYRFKYGEEQYLAARFAGFLRVPAGCEPDALAPVPLHPARLRARGFNQSGLLARRLSERIGVPLEPGLLCRVKQTLPQASLKGEARAGNVQGAFQAQNAQGKTILLIDDLLTSGNTLSACAEALRAAGARAVYAACVFAVVQH